MAPAGSCATLPFYALGLGYPVGVVEEVRSTSSCTWPQATIRCYTWHWLEGGLGLVSATRFHAAAVGTVGGAVVGAAVGSRAHNRGDAALQGSAAGVTFGQGLQNSK